MQKTVGIPGLFLSEEARDQTLDYLEQFDVPDCVEAGLRGLATPRAEVLKKSVLGIVYSLDPHHDNYEISRMRIRAGAGLAYFAFGFQEDKRVSPLTLDVLADQVDNLNRFGYINTFEQAFRNDINLHCVMAAVESRCSAFSLEAESKTVTGAGVIRYFLDKQFARNVVLSN
jgi:hypothetical protein